MRILIALIALTVMADIAFAEVSINMEAIMHIESRGDENAYNRVSKARGLYQITPICLKDFNKMNNEHYTVTDLFTPQVNSRIAYWYLNARIPQMLKAYGHPDTVENRLVAYNAGIRLVGKRLPPETKLYIIRYNALVGASNA